MSSTTINPIFKWIEGPEGYFNLCRGNVFEIKGRPNQYRVSHAIKFVGGGSGQAESPAQNLIALTNGTVFIVTLWDRKDLYLPMRYMGTPYADELPEVFTDHNPDPDSIVEF